MIYHNLSIYPCIYLPIFPSVHLSTYPAIQLSIYPSIHLSIYPSIHLSSHPSIHRSIYLSTYIRDDKFLSTFELSISSQIAAAVPKHHRLWQVESHWPWWTSLQHRVARKYPAVSALLHPAASQVEHKMCLHKRFTVLSIERMELVFEDSSTNSKMTSRKKSFLGLGRHRHGRVRSRVRSFRQCSGECCCWVTVSRIPNFKVERCNVNIILGQSSP